MVPGIQNGHYACRSVANTNQHHPESAGTLTPPYVGNRTDAMVHDPMDQTWEEKMWRLEGTTSTKCHQHSLFILALGTVFCDPEAFHDSVPPAARLRRAFVIIAVP